MLQERFYLTLKMNTRLCSVLHSLLATGYQRGKAPDILKRLTNLSSEVFFLITLLLPGIIPVKPLIANPDNNLL